MTFPTDFASRHIGPDSGELATMLGVIGVGSLDELAAKALPAGILDALGDSGIAPGLQTLPSPATEHQTLAELRELADANTIAVSMIGQGYYDTLTPPVLLRNILENPAWYTAYTPYQPEISQGRLEALLNFQTMVADLTGLDIANASMLDEAHCGRRGDDDDAPRLRRIGEPAGRRRRPLPADHGVLATRAEPLGHRDRRRRPAPTACPTGEFFGVIAAVPGCQRRGHRLVDPGASRPTSAARLVGRRRRPAGAAPCCPAGRDRRRHRVRHGSALRRADGVRRSARRLSGRPDQPARQLPGRLVGVSVDADGSAGLPPGAADPRTAHPPR